MKFAGWVERSNPSHDANGHMPCRKVRISEELNASCGLIGTAEKPTRRPPNQNIENNPMQRKEPLEKKGVAGIDASAAKNILTRRANQQHISIIAPIVDPPMVLPIVLSA